MYATVQADVEITKLVTQTTYYVVPLHDIFGLGKSGETLFRAGVDDKGTVADESRVSF